MDVREENNKKWQFFQEITGIAMEVFNEYRFGILESAYEAAMAFLLRQNGFFVERQVMLPIYWKDTELEQTCRMDMLVNKNIIIELKTVKYISKEHRSQLFHYLNLTHIPYGMLINFSPQGIYSEWYYRNENGYIERVKLI